MTRPVLPKPLLEKSQSKLEHDPQSRDVLEIAKFPSGRVVALTTDDHESLTVSSPSGRVELRVTFTEGGAHLDFQAADIALRAERTVSIDCNKLEVTAEDIEMTAKTGDVRVTANDRVSLVGEQVRFNCDREDEVPEWLAQLMEARLAGPGAKGVPRRDVTGDASLFDRPLAVPEQKEKA